MNKSVSVRIPLGSELNDEDEKKLKKAYEIAEKNEKECKGETPNIIIVNDIAYYPWTGHYLKLDSPEKAKEMAIRMRKLIKAVKLP